MLRIAGVTVLATLIVFAQARTWAQPSKFVVTIDAAAKSSTSGAPGVEVKGAQSYGQVFIAYLINQTRKPGQALVKITGLQPPASGYDVYLDRKLVGPRSIEELKRGIEIDLRAGAVSTADTEFASRVEKGCTEAVNTLKEYWQGDGKLVRDTINQVKGWTAVFVNTEERSRSTEILLSPSGTPLDRIPPDTRLTQTDMVAKRNRVFTQIMEVRRLLMVQVGDKFFRELAARALTPHDLSVKIVPVANARPGERKALVVYTNAAELPVSVTIRLVPPDGVTAKPTGKTDTVVLSRGQSLTRGYLLSGSVAKNAVESKGYALANVKLEKAVFSVKQTLPTQPGS